MYLTQCAGRNVSSYVGGDRKYWEAGNSEEAVLTLGGTGSGLGGVGLVFEVNEGGGEGHPDA